jgi:hypothetical protein
MRALAVHPLIYPDELDAWGKRIINRTLRDD